MFAKLASIAFWATGLTMTLAALAVPGAIIVLLIPLGGFAFVVFSLITLPSRA